MNDTVLLVLFLNVCFSSGTPEWFYKLATSINNHSEESSSLPTDFEESFVSGDNSTYDAYLYTPPNETEPHYETYSPSELSGNDSLISAFLHHIETQIMPKTENISTKVDLNGAQLIPENETDAESVAKEYSNYFVNFSSTITEDSTTELFTISTSQSLHSSSNGNSSANINTVVFLPTTQDTVLETTVDSEDNMTTYMSEIPDLESEKNTSMNRSSFYSNKSSDLTSETESYISENLKTESPVLIKNSQNVSEINEDQVPPRKCAQVLPEVTTNEFKAYLQENEDSLNKTEKFEKLLRSYFPDNACNLVVTSFSGKTVTWTDLSLNKSSLCSKAYKRKLFERIVDDQGVISKFHNFFLPDFDIQMVNWMSTVECNFARISSENVLSPLDITVYVLGSLLLIGVVTVVVVFLRGKTYESHSVDINSTPNTYQKYTLRSRQPAFLSPELNRAGIMATCNPAYVDDETLEPKAKHFVENC